MRHLMVYITARDKKQARAIGKALVAEHLAACANIFSGMDSIYFWKGKLCDERESALIVKTRVSLLGRLVTRVRSLHSYSVPCIVAVPVAGGNRDFIEWVDKETSEQKPVKRRRTGKIQPKRS